MVAGYMQDNCLRQSYPCAMYAHALGMHGMYHGYKGGSCHAGLDKALSSYELESWLLHNKMAGWSSQK